MCRKFVLIAVCFSYVWITRGHLENKRCSVRAVTNSGAVCGLTRWDENGSLYASFRGVPYAKQPIGELRFKELEPAAHWGEIDAINEGAICPQTDVFYENLMQPRATSEACIFANIHVPLYALPGWQEEAGANDEYMRNGTGLPILVFVHGGGFAFGSGDSDIYGPEYLVSRGVIVITFNYRLNVFGFLSLNTPSVPGNAGLRDIVTLLKWVKQNAEAFGGDPDNVTLGGQSAGAAAAHLVSLSSASDGLINRLILMSGTAIPSFYTTSPAFAQYISNLFVNVLGINSTDPEEIHEQLVEMPLEKITNANSFLLEQFGLTTFFPVVETPHPGVTTILEEEPEVLIGKGRGNYPMLIGFTNAECETFYKRFVNFKVVEKVRMNPIVAVSPQLIYNVKMETLLDIAKKVEQKYFNGTFDMDNFMRCCSDTYYIEPALELAKIRGKFGDAPAFLYEFKYSGDEKVFKEQERLFNGASHVEDMTYVFRANSVMGSHISFPPKTNDDLMKYWMTNFITNFVKCSEPLCHNNSFWPPIMPDNLRWHNLNLPKFRIVSPSKEQKEMLTFFQDLKSTKS